MSRYLTRHTLDFTYDASGRPLSLTYDGTPYYYALNLQGDVVAILDGSGNVVVSYVYDAWGSIRSITGSLKDTVGYYNPLRYRGYVWDPETGIYYLESRYYSPGRGRFLNADAFASTGQGLLGNNMFAYCNNNPVTSIDLLGTIPTRIYGDCYMALQDYSGDGSKTSGNVPVDITDRLNKAMITNAEELYSYYDMYGGPVAVMYFIEKVEPGGDWDFKSQSDWNLQPNQTYIYNGNEYSYDDIGNIHYGYVGRVLFPEKMLLLAGGLVQIYCGTSSWDYRNSFFDDPRDQRAIKVGCDLWEGGING